MEPSKPPKMTVALALAALNARTEEPRPRRPRPPSEHPWKFTDPAFNRMLDRGSDDFLDNISRMLTLLCFVAHRYKDKPYTKEEVWEAALAAGSKHYETDLDYFEKSETDIAFLMIDDVIAGTYQKIKPEPLPVSAGPPSAAVEALRKRYGYGEP
jgi:hypothetical protein